MRGKRKVKGTRGKTHLFDHRPLSGNHRSRGEECSGPPTLATVAEGKKKGGAFVHVTQSKRASLYFIILTSLNKGRRGGREKGEISTL